MEHTSGTDTRTETTDKPASSERPYTPPPDNPGSPGQRSRLESRARAREDAQQRAAQESQTTDSGTEPVAEGDDKPAPTRDESGGENEEAAGKPEIPGRENEEGEPPKDEGEQPKDDDRPQGTGTPADNTTGDPDQPTPGTGTAETDRPQDQEHRPLPQQDTAEPSDTGDPPTPEQDTRDVDEAANDNGGPAPEQAGKTADQSTGQQENRPDTTPDDPHPGDHAAQPAREYAPQIPDETADGQEPPAPDNEAGGPEPSGETPPTHEHQTTDQRTDPQEPPADSDAPDGDHGKKAEDDATEPIPDETNETNGTNPEAPANPILSNVYSDSRGQVHIEPRYGREQTDDPISELAPTEPETTNPAGLPAREDLDPVGEQGGEPGRGELRNPDDDAESRDLPDGDVEGLARWKKTGREFIRRPDEVAKTTEALAKDIGKVVNWDRPTGIAESKPSIEVKPHHESIQGANAAVGILGAGIVAYEVARRTRAGIRNIREKMTGEESARN